MLKNNIHIWRSEGGTETLKDQWKNLKEDFFSDMEFRLEQQPTIRMSRGFTKSAQERNPYAYVEI